MTTPNLERYRTRFSDYCERYENIRMQRADGILEMTLHTEDGPLRWSRHAHAQLEEAFLNIGRDRENKVVILTGTGDEFSGPIPDPAANKAKHKKTYDEVVELSWEIKGLLFNFLSIEAPIVAAVNGPAARHAELPVLCDIVLTADTATFQDSAHFVGGLVPGDGMHVVMPLLMGINRARYFLLTGQVIDANEAKEMGLVNEIVPNDKLMERARELARQIGAQPELLRRYTRTLLTEKLRRELNEFLAYGFALEGQGMTSGD